MRSRAADSAVCRLPLPARVLSLDPSARSRHWLSQGDQHGLNLQIESAVGPAELAEHVPSKVLRQLEALLVPEALKQARKGLGIWATNHRFLASVANSNATTLFLEDDTLLTPSFCTHTTRALRTIASLPTWDLLLPGHCGGVRDRNCSRILGTTSNFPLYVTRGLYPMCTHAYIVSPRGAARMHALLTGWPQAYAASVLRTAKPGWETTGVPRGRRPTKRPVDDMHDVAVAKLVFTGQLEAYPMWPQAALQPWMVSRPHKGGLALGTADRGVPSVCKRSCSQKQNVVAGLPCDFSPK